MKGDFTRDTFQPEKHLRQTLMQQGRVQLDADWNEQTAIVARRDETTAEDLIGHGGGPLDSAAFGAIPSLAAPNLPAEFAAWLAARPAAEKTRLENALKAGDFLLGAGRYYVGGVQCELETPVLFTAQPDFHPAVLAPGFHLLYLDVWFRHLTAVEDPSLLEVALGGVDVATRVKTVWQVRAAALAANQSPPGPAPCALGVAAFNDATYRSALKLAAQLEPAVSNTDPCQVPETSAYKGLENQLYRVEIHELNANQTARTLKWSRENGSVVSRLLKIDPTTRRLTVDSIGRDSVLGFAADQWLEILDDEVELAGASGQLIQIAGVLEEEQEIVLKFAPNQLRPAFPGGVDPGLHPKVRRWEGVANVSANWTAIEAGIQVRFETPTAVKARVGDYWQIPARTANASATAGNIEWPRTPGANPAARFLAPLGVEHRYCRLGLIQVKAPPGPGTFLDCRALFPPLTDLTTLRYVGGDGQEATPRPQTPAASVVLPHALVVGVANGARPVAGARVNFTVTLGGGTLLGPNAGVVVTGADGLARCQWQIGLPSVDHEVRAELSDAGGRSLPVWFHARLNVAEKVAYDPANCEGMNQATPPVVTVQGALDFLCARDAAATAECCVTVGRSGGVAGDYATLADAVDDLLGKQRRASVCFSLLPGDHVVAEEISFGPADRKTPIFVKIAGCNHAARLVVQQPLKFGGLVGAAIIRDITVEIAGREALIDFSHTRRVEISTCVLTGRRPDDADPLLPLIAIEGAERATFRHNVVSFERGGESKGPDKIFGANANLAKLYQIEAEGDFQTAVRKTAKTIAALAPAKRRTFVAQLAGLVKTAGAGVPPLEREGYQRLIAAVAKRTSTAEFLAAQLAEVRTNASSAATTGLALVLIGLKTATTLEDNQIGGSIRLGGRAPGNRPDLKTLLARLRTGECALAPAAGTLHVRGNSFHQLALSDEALAPFQKLQPVVAVLRAAFLTDNIIKSGDNFVAAYNFSMNATYLWDGTESVSATIAAHCSYFGNSAERGAVWMNVSLQIKPATNPDDFNGLRIRSP